MITLQQIIERLPGCLCTGVALDAHYGAVVSSSMHATEGSVFVAIRGTKGDGHNFINDAFAKGSTLAIVEDADALEGKAGVIVKDTRSALSALAALFEDDPTRSMSVIGVTGTNGKTTTHWMIAHLLGALGQQTVRIGTIGVATPTYEYEGSLTTPDPIELQRTFARAKASGCTHAVMEVSSHALDQKRVEDVSFDVGVFSNLTRDHLDYHETMHSYAEAKAKLFTLIGKHGKCPRAAVINAGSEWGEWFQKRAAAEGCSVLSYGEREECSLWILDFSQAIGGSVITFRFQGEEFSLSTPFIGRYNGENLIAACLAVASLGFDFGKVVDAAKQIPQVPGRLESCGSSQVGVYVDYAHTPDALENALKALRPITTGALWAVFGCGGDRDRGKRPQMAKIAAEYGDKVVVTSDNPRTEDPCRIIEDILSEGVVPDITDPDRAEAIRKTLSAAKPGDVVLIAGKGHENYQIIGTEKRHFSDQEIVRDFYKGIR